MMHSLLPPCPVCPSLVFSYLSPVGLDSNLPHESCLLPTACFPAPPPSAHSTAVLLGEPREDAQNQEGADFWEGRLVTWLAGFRAQRGGPCCDVTAKGTGFAGRQRRG